MSKKKKDTTEHIFDDDLIFAVKEAWSNNLYYYPKIVKGLSPKVKIAKKKDGIERVGSGIYEQDDTLYEKIRGLYLDEYKKNKTK